MAYFNEENTVEQMLINAAGQCGWIYVEPQFVPRLPDFGADGLCCADRKRSTVGCEV